MKRGVVSGTFVLALLAGLPGAAQAQARLEVDDLPGPPPEVAVGAGSVKPPPLPTFELPASEAGFVSARELRVRGLRHLGSDVKVKGYVTWIYDCAAALAAKNPRAKKAAIQRAIDRDATACDRPRLALADVKGASREASITVVEVPRPPNQAERQKLSKEALAGWPRAPKLVAGDHVIAYGKWTTKGPRGDVDPYGLLVYGGLEVTAPAATAPAPVIEGEEQPPPVVTVAPKRKVVTVAARTRSIQQLGECNRATTAGDFDAALRACRAATATWDGNHLAWYTLASAHMAKGQWPEARGTVAKAVALRPDLAMYQLYHGVALFEEAQQVTEMARRGSGAPAGPGEAKHPALASAKEALRRAAQLNPALWRAHFYLGRVYRELDDSRRAAEQLVATIETHPTYRYSYVALVQVLRRWSYVDAALAFAQLGAQQVPGEDAADLWIEVGMLREQKADDEGALEAFGKALALRPGDGRALLQRGQVLLRRGELEGARRDLEEAQRSSDPQLASARPFLQELLARIAASAKKPGRR